MSISRLKARAFTLIELLVVIAVIAILASLVQVLATGSDFKEFAFLHNTTTVYTLEDVAKAEQVITSALQADPASESAKYYLAVVRERRNRLERPAGSGTVLLNVISDLETRPIAEDDRREEKSERVTISLDRAEYGSRDSIQISVAFSSREGGDFYNLFLNGGKARSFRLALFDGNRQMVADFGAHVDGSVWKTSLSDWHTVSPKEEVTFKKLYSLERIKRLKSAGAPFLRPGRYYVQLVYLNRVYTARGSDFKEGMASENTDKDAISSNAASFSITD